MIALLNNFPGEFGRFRKVIFNMDQLKACVNRANGKMDCQRSVYAFTELFDGRRVDYESLIFDRVFIDLDEEPYADIWTLHSYLLENDIIHYIQRSGDGYQTIVFCLKNILFSRDCLRNFQLELQDEIDITIDVRTIGDITRHFRIPFTYNPEAKIYCNPLDKKHLNMKHHKIEDWCKKQRFHISGWYGSKLMNLLPYDRKTDFYKMRKVSIGDIPIDKSVNEILRMYDNPAPCIKFLLNWRRYHPDKEMGRNRRSYLILGLKEMGLYPEETIAILHKILPNFATRRHPYGERHHSIVSENQVYYVYRKDYYWNCEHGILYGVCIRGCKLLHPFYK